MAHIRSHSLPGSLVLAVCAVAALAPPRGATTLLAQSATADAISVVREALVSGSPASAPGQELGLIRFVIPPGTRLPPHTHPGMQVGVIESGVLHYVVVGGGESRVHRKATPGRPASTETMRAGDSTDLHPGDTLVEPEHLVHYGVNRGAEPIVILVAVLLREGQPTATIVETPED